MICSFAKRHHFWNSGLTILPMDAGEFSAYLSPTWIEKKISINNIEIGTVDGSEIRRSPVEVGSLSHYLQCFIHPRWLDGISSINGISPKTSVLYFTNLKEWSLSWEVHVFQHEKELGGFSVLGGLFTPKVPAFEVTKYASDMSKASKFYRQRYLFQTTSCSKMYGYDSKLELCVGYVASFSVGKDQFLRSTTGDGAKTL